MFTFGKKATAQTLESKGKAHFFSGPAFGMIQPKLTINNPNDEYEREADVMAERVVNMERPEVQTTPRTISSVQRKCAECEEEEKEKVQLKAIPGSNSLVIASVNNIPGSLAQRKCASCEAEEKKELQRQEIDGRPSETDASPALESYLSGLSSSGTPLPDDVKSFYEPRFGYNFGNVKVHTDSAAAASAQSINALAYTSGSDIVFNAGQFAPDTESGKRLLGHELTHVVQQKDNSVHRAASDFRVKDLPANAAAETDKIFFEYAGTTIPASEVGKIAALATPPARKLTLHGFASEEGTAASRATTVASRLNAVEQALISAGHTGTRAKVPHPGEGVGDIDYRHRRAVQVLPTPLGLLSAPTTVNPCDVPGSEVAAGAALTSCNTAFTTAFPTARAIVDAAERDVVTTPTVPANALVSRFFSGVPRADVNANVRAIAAQVRALPARHRCHTSCDGGCGRPAYNSGRGLGPGGAMMTLCPDFVTAGLDFRIKTLIHEAAHANPVESIKDIAYSNTRLITFLLPADSRRNTDSYVLLMRLVHTPGSMAVGPAAPDVLSGMTAVGPGSDTEQSQRAIAWLESWLNYGDFDTEILYNTINASLIAGAWITTGSNEFNIETMHRLATAFPDLTDPGVDGSVRSTPPQQRDKVNVAAIHDRYDQMYEVVNQSPITVTRGVAESWGSLVALPRLTRSVTVLPSFYALSRVEQVKHLVRLMVRARSDISAGFRERYVTALDLIHTHRTLGP